MGAENRIRQAGMLNLGNTGYLEVILQTLYHCRDFQDLVLGLDLTGKPNDCPATFDMVRELQIIFRTWYTLEHVLPPAEDPDERVQHETLRLVYSHINSFIGPIGAADPTNFAACLKRCLQLKNPIDDPNDAHDFLRTFLRKIQTFVQMEQQQRPILGAAQQSSVRQRFQTIFVTTLANVTRCAHCSTNLPGLYYQDVPLRSILCHWFDCHIPPQQQDSTSTGEPTHLTPLLLDELSVGERITTRIQERGHCHCHCTPAGQRVPTHLFRVPLRERLPTILTVRFVRWPPHNRNAYIEFDEYLNVPNDKNENGEAPTTTITMYRLLSIVVHHGSSSERSGRYFSFCRTEDQWGQFWGTTVRPVEWDTIQRESFGRRHHDRGGPPSSTEDEEPANVAYLLFYERMKKAA